jgi:O-antigen/teichoic acid export membrane protein
VTQRTAPSRSRDSAARLFSDALAGRIAVAGFSLINIAVVARSVGPSTYGIYAAATGFSTILYFFTDLGSSSVVVREASDAAGRERAVAAFVHTRLLLIVLTCMFGAALVPLVFDDAARSAAYLALAVLVFSGPSIASPLGQIDGSMRLYRTSAVIQGAAQLLLTVGLVLLVADPEAVELVGALVLAAAISTAWVVVGLQTQLRELPSRVDHRAVRSMLRSVGLLGLSGVLVTVYYRIDGLLLLRISGAHEAGLYAAAYRLLDQAKILPAVVLVPVAPLLAHELAGRARLRVEVDRPLMTMALLGGIGLGCVGGALSP